MEISNDLLKWILGAMGFAIVSVAAFLRDLFKKNSEAKDECLTNYAELKGEVGELKGRQEGVEWMAKQVLEEVDKFGKEKGGE